MWVHVQGKTAAGGALVIPAGTLACTLNAVEDPPPEFESKSGWPPKESASGEGAQLLQAGQVDLVLDRAGLEPPRPCRAQQCDTFGHGRGHRLLAVDVLARCDRFGQRHNPLLCRGGVEENGITGLCKGRTDIGCPLRVLIASRNLLEPRRIAADQ